MAIALNEQQRALLASARAEVANEQGDVRNATGVETASTSVLDRISGMDAGFSERIEAALVDLPIDENHEVMNTVQQIESKLSVMKKIHNDETKQQERMQLSKDLSSLRIKLQEMIVAHTKTLLQRPRIQKIRQEYHVMWSNRDAVKRRKFLHELMTQESKTETVITLPRYS